MPSFVVDDIHCDGCVAAILKAVRGLDPAATVRADLASKHVTIAAAASDEALRDAIEAAGFSPAPAAP